MSSKPLVTIAAFFSSKSPVVSIVMRMPRLRKNSQIASSSRLSSEAHLRSAQRAPRRASVSIHDQMEIGGMLHAPIFSLPDVAHHTAAVAPVRTLE